MPSLGMMTINALVAAIKESDKNCSKEESRFNQLLLALADEVKKEHKIEFHEGK